MARYIGVKPAYGRDYPNQGSVMKDWLRNKDFQMTDFRESGAYINRQDVNNRRLFPITPHIIVRYGKLQKTLQVC